MMPLLVVWAALGLLVRGHARLLLPAHSPLRAASGKASGGVGADLSLFCFAFFPGRPSDMDKLPEARLQLSHCDHYMFFTDDKATLNETVHDLTRVPVPKQKVNRSDEGWLNHKNMAAITPVWAYLLRNGIAERYDWTLNVELDHFTRPSKVRSAIANTVEMLKQGNPWEKSFFPAPPKRAAVKMSGPMLVGGHDTMKPLLLAFGNAFVLNRAMVKEMKPQWPVRGMSEDHGCPTWGKHCEQDMVYPRMLSAFRPPIQLFGPTGCGRTQYTQGGRVLPFACWDFHQNPDQPADEYQTRVGQLKAIAKINAGRGRAPAKPDFQAVHITPRLMNITETEAEAYWPGTGTRRLLERAETMWENIFPPRDIPIIHHAMDGAVLKEARKLLGL